MPSQTRKMRKNPNTNKITQTLLEILMYVKLQHWNTREYNEHIATDELYQSLNSKIDKFIEILLAKKNIKINIPSIYIDTKTNFVKKMRNYETFLLNINSMLPSDKISDLITIRDDILGDINRAIYLFSFE